MRRFGPGSSPWLGPDLHRGGDVAFNTSTNPIYRTREHRKARADLLKAYTPGDPCCLCGHPMWPPTSNLHADHIPGTNQYRGLAHGSKCPTCGKYCNQVDGARRGRARRNASPTPSPALRRWQL